MAEQGAGAVYLNHRHVFGIKADVKSNIHFHDENQVIYCAGHNTVQYFTEHKSQRVFPGSEGTTGITCLAVSPSKRYLAIAERSPENAQVTVYDLVTTKKRKTLTYPEIDAQEFVSIAFSSENKFLITQGGLSPSGKHDWTLVYWSWEKARVMASQKVSNPSENSIHEVSINPTDSEMVCVVGDSVLKFLRLQEGSLKQSQNQLYRVREAQNYLCHAWLTDDRLVVGCENGDLLLFDASGEFKMTLPCSVPESKSVCCIQAYSKGFVTGGANSMLRLYEKSDDPKEMFRKAREVKVDSQPVTVRSLAMSPPEETLACTTSSAQLYQLSLLGSDLLKADDTTQVEPMLTGFHVGPILGMDVCIRKPWVVTCGMDKTVRVWNYLEKTCELSRSFNEEAYSVAFHPSGFHLIVGFSDKLRLMNLLMEDMRPFKDLPIKACREVKFAHGGHMFAAVNSNTIQVFKTYSCEMICNLRGHNNKVRSLSWTADDTTLVSAGMDGAVYEYNILNDGRRESDWVHKGTNFSCVIVYTDPSTGGNTTYVVGSDKMLREVAGSSMQNYLVAGKNIGQICLSNSARTMFSSISEPDYPGSIRCYKFPLDGEYIEYQAHASPATRLRVTVDDQYLFSAGEDACLFIFDVRKKDRVISKRDKEATLPFADEIMVTRTFLDEKQAKLGDLERQVDELRNQIDFQLRHRDSYHKEKMSELEDKYTQEIEQERTKFELLREEKNDMEMEYEENFKNVEELHAKQIQDLEASFQHKMMIEVAKYQKLAVEREREHEEWQRQHKSFIEAHARKVQELTKKFEDQEAEDRAHKQRIMEEKDMNSKVHGETLRQLEQDSDMEIEELKKQYKDRLSTEHDDKVRLKGRRESTASTTRT
jgi:WD40 repeat protein